MYPLKFNNIYYKKIWGGNEFSKFRTNVPEGDIGESWDICSRDGTVSVVANGLYKGITLKELINTQDMDLLGTAYYSRPFPLLIKIINARDKLSLQVHPPYGFPGETLGKNEFWYIMDCDPEASVILGINCSRERFTTIINNKDASDADIESCLNRVHVKPGDFFYVGGGLIHAIGKGIILAEIQDNSDITYRLYDYGRGRELNVEKGLAAVDLESAVVKPMGENRLDSWRMKLSIHNINGSLQFASDKRSFHTLTCVYGFGILKYVGGAIKIMYGESILIPAALGKYEVKGQLKLIKMDLK